MTMIKKLYFFSILMAILLNSCGPKHVKIVEEKFEDGSPKIVRQYEIKGKDSILLRESVFYQNGQKYMEGKYYNNQRDSIWTAWLPDGKIWSQGGYKQGLEDGPKKVFYSNGSLFYEGQHKMGKRIGVWKFYDSTGNLIQTIDYTSTSSGDTLSH